MSSNEILVISAGGTILKRQHGSGMEWSVNIEELLQSAAPSQSFSIIKAYEGLAANFKLADIVRIARIIKTSPLERILITLGTDVLEEVAFALDYILGADKKIVISAAMRPYDREGYDGVLNLRDGIEFLLHSEIDIKGVFCVINEQIFAGRQIYKHHSTRADAFSAYPGAVGEIISGKLLLHNMPTPNTTSKTSLLDIPLEVINSLSIPILWAHTDMRLDYFQLSSCHGLVVAGMGAGSIPDFIRSELSKYLTNVIPVAISTRCSIGPSHAENLYTGSLEKYTSVGFLVNEFNGLNALQARLKLHMEIATASVGVACASWLSRFYRN
jgi:L-asparaginase